MVDTLEIGRNRWCEKALHSEASDGLYFKVINSNFHSVLEDVVYINAVFLKNLELRRGIKPSITLAGVHLTSTASSALVLVLLLAV